MTQKQKFNYIDIEKLLIGCNKCGEQSNQPFRNKMLRNMSLFQDELEKQYDTIKEPEGIEEYREKEGEIIQKYAIGYRDDRSPIYGDDSKVAREELNELRELNKGMLDVFKRQKKHFYEVVMHEEITFRDQIRFIADTELPKSLTLAQANGIAKLITYIDDKPRKKK